MLFLLLLLFLDVDALGVFLYLLQLLLGGFAVLAFLLPVVLYFAVFAFFVFGHFVTNLILIFISERYRYFFFNLKIPDIIRFVFFLSIALIYPSLGLYHFPETVLCSFAITSSGLTVTAVYDQLPGSIRPIGDTIFLLAPYHSWLSAPLTALVSYPTVYSNLGSPAPKPNASSDTQV